MSAEPHFKRRRLNENSRILQKPFVSPLKPPNNARQPLRPKDDARDRLYLPSVHAHTIQTNIAKPRSLGKADNTSQTPFRSTPSCKPRYSLPPTKPPNNAEIAAQKALTQLELQLRTIRSDIDTLTQASRIRSSSTNTHLKDLTQKWKVASQAAAEEVFETVKERVDHMGGLAAWRRSEMQEFDGGGMFDDFDGHERRNDDREFDSEGEEMMELEKERRRGWRERDMRDAQKHVRDNAEPEDDVFTKEMMLRSLNIELDVIGYDKANDSWIV